MKKLLPYLKQRSTYVGLSLLLGAFGIAVSPDQIQAIGIGLLGLWGLVETVRNEDKSDEVKVAKVVARMSGNAKPHIGK